MTEWEARFEEFVAPRMPASDAAHDLAHVRRVVANARALADQLDADLNVVIPAAWLHDCVVVPKDSSQRPMASRLAAQEAEAFLLRSDYPRESIPAIGHAIEAHSFTAKITPETLEAKIVQDADRLDAIGAIGIARCLLLGGAMGKPLYDEDEPFPTHRPADDSRYVIDHFYTKLLKLVDLMQTSAGRAEGERRTRHMRVYLEELGRELGNNW